MTNPVKTPDGPVLMERHRDVAVLCLNRPQARNAIDHAMAQAIVDSFRLNTDIGAIVLTGQDPAFCAGLDLRSLGVGSLSELPGFVAAVRSSTVPVVAAVNGPAVTGGFELALASDFIVGSDRALFADTHVRVGVYPGPVLVDLPRRVGMAWAREMSLTGNFVDAETALRIGLLNHLVPHDELLPYAIELAQAIAENDRQMVAAMRRDWDLTGGLPLLDAHHAHEDYARSHGNRQVLGADLASRRDAVLSRSRQQRNPKPEGQT